jgi:hypothetical protein
LHDAAAIVVTDTLGDMLPAQGTALCHWPDGSIKWLLLDTITQVPAEAETVLAVAAAEAPSTPLGAIGSGDGLTLDDGELVLTLPTTGQLMTVAVTGVDTVATLSLLDVDGVLRDARVTEVIQEASGPVRGSVTIHGLIDATLLAFTCRIDAFSGLSAVRIAVTLHNPQAAKHENGLWDLGDDGSVLFGAFSWRVTGDDDDAYWCLTPGGEVAEGSVAIHQASSGGDNWDSLNHVGRDGRVNLPFKGYQVHRDGELVSAGDRCQPAMARGQLALSLEQFWQNFPKRLNTDADGLCLDLFPFQTDVPHELQGGERKTHRFWLAVGDDALSRAADLAAGVTPVLDPIQVAKSGAIAMLQPLDADGEYARAVAPAAFGDRAFVHRRELIDEYGWRNFGDLFADHEGQFYTGDAPLISHYNNQYDVIYGLLIQYLRSGDEAWWQPAEDLARHVVDIDIYHTTQDRAAYNGGLFWHTDHYEHAASATHRTYSKASLKGRSADQYGGGPANEHAYSSGLLLHYYLTGDPHSKAAVTGLADWLMAMDDGCHTVLGWVDNGPTGAASRTCETEYHGPGRGAGNAINVLLDAATLSDAEVYLSKAEQLIRRSVHPADDLAALALDQPELRWSYTVYLQALGRYLMWKEERGALDEHYDYARQALLHYADWVAQHEVPYLSQPERLEFPTETWAAQDIRKACVLDLAARYRDPIGAIQWRERAAYFYQDALARLAGFESADATRPLAILLSCGWQRAYFSSHGEDAAPSMEARFEHGVPTPFISQKRRVLSRIKSPLMWPKLVWGLLNNGPKKWRAS